MFEGYFLANDSTSNYIGGWLDSRRSGQGTMMYRNGDVYEGEWSNDNRHGQGVLRDAGRNVISRGIWENDVFIRSN